MTVQCGNFQTLSRCTVAVLAHKGHSPSQNFIIRLNAADEVWVSTLSPGAERHVLGLRVITSSPDVLIGIGQRAALGQREVRLETHCSLHIEASVFVSDFLCLQRIHPVPVIIKRRSNLMKANGTQCYLSPLTCISGSAL